MAGVVEYLRIYGIMLCLLAHVSLRRNLPPPNFLSSQYFIAQESQHSTKSHKDGKIYNYPKLWQTLTSGYQHSESVICERSRCVAMLLAVKSRIFAFHRIPKLTCADSSQLR
jgi:hypothetical protein